jgi:hypothetical protein
MRKIGEAKVKQGYVEKPVHAKCSNCKYFQSEEKVEEGYYMAWTKEVNLRCGLGGFAIKKQGVCNQHEMSHHLFGNTTSN